MPPAQTNQPKEPCNPPPPPPPPELRDKIALRAASDHNDTAIGFSSGRQLVVQPADAETAWLGLPATATSTVNHHGPAAEAAPSDVTPALGLPPVRTGRAATTMAQPIQFHSHHGQTTSAAAPQTLPAPPRGTTTIPAMQPPPHTQPTEQQLMFRSLESALEAARDGDEILLLPGTHNVRSPGGLVINRRVLISGGSPLVPAAADDLQQKLAVRPSHSAAFGAGTKHSTEDASAHNSSSSNSSSNSKQAEAVAGCKLDPAATAVIDYRGNSPLFRISRPCMLQGFEVDMVGFAPAIVIGGKEAVAPLLVNLRVACSGDDSVDVGGAARPQLVDCTLTVGLSSTLLVGSWGFFRFVGVQ